MRLADLIGLTPAMTLFGLFILLPLLAAFVLSFFRWNGLGAPHWAGGANWVQFAHDPVAATSLVVTAKVVALSWVVQTPLSLAGTSGTGRCTRPATCCRCCCPRPGSR
jgi:raffinose/stachyose/melibiose transport system permease protein